MRPRSLPVILVVSCLALVAALGAGAATKPARVTKVDAICAGDIIGGKIKVSAPTMVSLELLTRRAAKAKFLLTNKRAWVRARQAGSYKFTFDISRMNANAYRVQSKSGTKSRILPAASCAPGYQVPEAPFVILLPLSLLLTLGLAIGMRRFRLRTTPHHP